MLETVRVARLKIWKGEIIIINDIAVCSNSPAVPHSSNFRSAHLCLEYEDTVQKSLGRWRTSRDIDIYGYDAVNPSNDRVAVMIVSSTIGTATHANDPFWVRHLVVTLAHSWRHLVGNSTCDDHCVRLSWGCSKYNTKSVLIVSRHGGMHHFDTTASQTKRKWP